MMQSVHHYCSYFDHRYLPRGLAMIRSLRRFDPDAVFWVLCLSDAAADALRALAEPNVKTISLAEFELGDAELVAAKATRSLVEYYFTCTPSLVRYVLDRAAPEDIVTYADGDLFFYSSPAPLYDALGTNSVSIIRHRFPADRADLEKYGVYNVGWLSFRNDAQGHAVAAWWRERCNEWCFDLFEEERFADQKYLDRFPQFPGVVELTNPGANLAPWNLRTHILAWSDGQVRIDGAPLIFFHFHGLQVVGGGWYLAAHCDYGARFDRLLREHVYRPYLSILHAIEKEVRPLVPAPAGSTLSRGGSREGLVGRLKRRLRRPKRLTKLFLHGQAIKVSRR